MANTKQAKRMVRKIQKRTQSNRWHKRRVKIVIKELEKVKKGSDKFKKLSSKLQKTIDKATKNGVYKKNTAARIKSRLLASSSKN